MMFLMATLASVTTVSPVMTVLLILMNASLIRASTVGISR